MGIKVTDILLEKVAIFDTHLVRVVISTSSSHLAFLATTGVVTYRTLSVLVWVVPTIGVPLLCGNFAMAGFGMADHVAQVFKEEISPGSRHAASKIVMASCLSDCVILTGFWVSATLALQNS